jgi:hypothetical protein
VADEFQNFIGGQWTDTSYDRRSDLINPANGEVFGTAPVSSKTEVDAAVTPAADAFRPGATHPSERSLACCGSPTRSSPGGRVRRSRVPEHRQARRADAGRGNPADGGPDPVLHHAARMLEGFAMNACPGSPVHPARADRRHRRGDPVELPDDDGGGSGPRPAAGNTMVLKPSDTTPASTLLMAETMAGSCQACST